MAFAYNQDLVSERIRNSSEIDFDDIQCSICSNILWKPVACQSCETPFCSICIAKWITKNPGKCPIKCNEYIERSCPRFVLRQLSKLQIDCIYKFNGCNEVTCPVLFIMLVVFSSIDCFIRGIGKAPNAM